METFKYRIPQMLTFLLLASLDPPDYSHQMFLSDERCLLGKRRGNAISLFVRAHKFLPYVI